MTSRKPRVLLTNDDGPPGPQSPYLYGLYRHLTKCLGWDVKVVIPSSQKSWIGKAYHITEIVKGRYYYPQDPVGEGETSNVSRPLRTRETAEWILLDSTPATCANVGLHNIYHGQIDLLISGPNLGRNTSAAFALSSGTIGAALSSSLSQVRSIAVSYGIVVHPTPPTFHEPAHRLTAGVVNHLWSNWGTDDGGLRNGEVDLYNLNVPMIERLLSDNGLEIVWTTMWRNSYGQLFKALSSSEDVKPCISHNSQNDDRVNEIQLGAESPSEDAHHLVFKFSPDLRELINPSPTHVPIGSDGWAMTEGYVSVTPLRASFAEPLIQPGDEKRIWKIKL